MLAKIYHAPPSAPVVMKLSAMVESPPAVPSLAWPRELLLENSRVVGFLMPGAGGHAIAHAIETPLRRRDFPNASWRFLVRLARNTATLFEGIHKAGLVAGDVSDRNLLVESNATVTLIDCDSMQISAASGLHRCTVRSVGWTAPELINADLQSVERTPDHDRFALALLIFHILFPGRHPFAGVPPAGVDLCVEQAITQHRFVYSRRRPENVLKRPPLTFSLDLVPGEISVLFENAFDPAFRGIRPSGALWAAALTRFERELIVCPANANHTYHKNLGKRCPWCGAEKLGLGFFRKPRKTAYSLADLSKLNTPQPLIQQLDALTRQSKPGIRIDPTATPVAGTPYPWFARPFTQFQWWTLVVSGMAAGLGAIRFDPLFVWPAIGAASFLVLDAVELLPKLIAKRRRTLLTLAEERFARVRDDAKRRVENHFQKFTQQRDQAGELRRFLDAFGIYARQKHEEACSALEDEAIRSRLAAIPIRLNVVEGFGPERIRVLQAAGILTAADIPPTFTGVPSIGPALSARLLAWRDTQATFLRQQYRFNPSEEQEDEICAAILQDHRKVCADLNTVLENARIALQECERELLEVEALLEKEVAALARARADLACGGFAC